jgi:hypothetical protein
MDSAKIQGYGFGKCLATGFERAWQQLTRVIQPWILEAIWALNWIYVRIYRTGKTSRRVLRSKPDYF